jgi:anti-anti-sigma factor
MQIDLDGRLDARNSADVKATLNSVLDNGYRKIIVNLEKVSFIDSAGLVALVSGLRSANEKHGQIVLCGAQSQAQVVFRLTMLDRVFSIHTSQLEARQSFA